MLFGPPPPQTKLCPFCEKKVPKESIFCMWCSKKVPKYAIFKNELRSFDKETGNTLTNIMLLEEKDELTLYLRMKADEKYLKTVMNLEKEYEIEFGERIREDLKLPRGL